MKFFTGLGLIFMAIGGWGLYMYFTGGDPLNFAGNCNSFATASKCDEPSFGYMVVGLVFGFIGLMFMGMVAIVKRARKREAAFNAVAVPATGTIISVDQPMNATVNNQPLLTFLLEVSPPTGPTYQATVRGTVSPLVMSQVKLTPGSELPLKLNPANPQDIRIDWNAAAMTQQAETPAAAAQG